MRPEPEVKEALDVLAYIIDKASPGHDRESLEHAAFALRWVLRLKSPLAGIVKELGKVKPMKTPPAPLPRSA